MTGIEYQYVNLNLCSTQGDLFAGRPLSAAKQTFNFSQIVLRDPSQWYGMISRLSANLFNVPLLVPQVLLGQSNPNLLNYQWQLAWTSAGGTTTYSDYFNVIYIKNSSLSPTAAAPTTMQDLTTDYYYIYSYDSFITMWNNVLALALINLNTKVATGVTIPPVFYYDPELGVRLQAPKASYEYTFNSSFTRTPSRISIYCSPSLTQFINGFQMQDVGNMPCSTILCMYQKPNNVVSISGVDYYNVGMTNIANTSTWPSIQNLNLITSMPVFPEFAQASDGNPQVSSQSYVTLLTDIYLDNTQAPVVYNSQLIYNKVENIRLFNFTSQSQIQNITFEVQWQDHYGNVYPLLLSPRCNVNLKLEFKKK